MNDFAGSLYYSDLMKALGNSIPAGASVHFTQP